MTIIAAAMGGALGVLLTVWCVYEWLRRALRRYALTVVTQGLRGLAVHQPVVHVPTVYGETVRVRTADFADAVIEGLGEP